MSYSGDVVVNGYRYPQADLATIQQIRFSTNDNPGDSTQNGYSIQQNPDNGQTEIVVNVRVHVTDPANLEKAKAAAQNVATALLLIVNALLNQPRNTTVYLLNGAYTFTGNFLDAAQNTAFIITDVSQANSRGVGASDPDNHTDTLDFRAFDGTTGPNNYADPNYNGQGMLGIMLHELVHLTDVGVNNRNDEIAALRRENALQKTRTPFEDSAYWADNEVYANKSAAQLAQNIGLDISLYNQQAPQQVGPFGPLGDDYEGPDNLFDLRNPQ